MDRAELQARQRPLKDRYRDEPGAACITLTATGSLRTQLCSGDMLLDTLPRLTERYCVVLQTIAAPPELSVARAAA